MSSHQIMPFDEKEKKILENQVDGLPSERTSRTVFAYATPFDLTFLAVSILSAVIAGALNPLLTVIFGQLVDAFQGFSNSSTSSSNLKEKTSRFTLYFVYLGIAMFVFVYISTVGFYFTGERITRKLKRAYLEAIVRQNIAFFDVVGAGEVTNRISSEMDLVQEAISGKISLSLSAAASFSAAFIIAFVEYWKLAFILTSSLVVMLTVNIACTKLSVKYSRASLGSSSRAAAVADEAISSIKYVTAFGLQTTLAEKYYSHLLDTEKYSVKARLALAVTISTFMGVLSLSYGLAFWQGSHFLNNGEMSGGSVVTIVMAIVIGSLAVGRVAPNTQAFMSGIAGASSILTTIGRRSPQDPLSEEGVKLDIVKGDIIFRDVSLVYPSRNQVKVLKELNLNLPASKTTAIVGTSGSGKSSVVGLIERFYDPVQGQIFLDGFDIQALNLSWLRQQISLVGQEPILFSTSIFENIRQGLVNASNHTSEQLHELVVGAAKKANAHDFIIDLPRGYQTEVGEGGLQLSGGQRQRIAIARALVKDPIILILDEAMSALDAKAEQEVQIALEKAAIGRTTVIIAHRLSTIRGADNIAVIARGCVAEQGSHLDLMARDGIYAKLVHKQELVSAEQSPQEPLTSNSSFTDGNESVNVGGVTGHIMSLKKSGSEAAIHRARPGKSVSKYNSTSEGAQVSLWTLAKVVARFNKPEALTMALGLCCSVIAGCAVPVQAVIFAESIDKLSLPTSVGGIAERGIDFWSLMYLMLGIVVFAAWLGQGFCFALSAERLIRRARDFTFRSILRQDVLFFDENLHSTGALTASLSTSTTQLAGLSGAVLGTILTASATLGGGIILSLVIGWKLALVCTATIPVILGCGWARLKMLALVESKVRKANTESASYATEVVKSIRTVASLNLENYVLDKYVNILEVQARESLKSIFQASVLYAASQSGVMFVAALGFWYGGTLIADHEYTTVQFFICQAALISGTQQVGAIFSFAPDMSKAVHASQDLKAIFDRRPGIDTWAHWGEATDSCRGRIELKNVSFHYPSRDQRRVLDNVNISIEAGQYVALVGSSGCGKSTIIALLERFFDPVSGQILIDGKDITHLNINKYRHLISFVGQESTIYQGSIRENIVLGVDEEVSEEDMIKACKEASIYDFILSLPDGFSTTVGYGGTLLSGGQKQRLAIARALLRDTKILLLDEATSALDADSEKVVQQALDRAVKTRTTIAVAHRLSTIQNADAIFVLGGGRVVEWGAHEELMRLKGKYRHLVEIQRTSID